jgi:hypothetical protein
MSLSGNKKRLICHIQSLAEKYHYSLTELYPGQNNRVVCLQPYDMISQAGPDKETVIGLNQLFRIMIPAHLKQGVTLNTKSKASEVCIDDAESEPDPAASNEIYYIELRFF